MSQEKLLNVREAAAYLRISEKAVISLAQRQVIPAYKVGGVYLRFKQDQIKGFKITPAMLSDIEPGEEALSVYPSKRNLREKISDFLYFNDFYLFCFFLSLVLLYLVFFT